MQSTSTPTETPLSPTSVPASTGKWKRGRPVSANYGSLKSMNGAPGLFSQRPSLQYTRGLGLAMMGGQSQLRPASNTRHSELPEGQSHEVLISDAFEHMHIANSPQVIEKSPTLAAFDSQPTSHIHTMLDHPSHQSTAIEEIVQTEKETVQQTEQEGGNYEGDTAQQTLPKNNPTSQDINDMENNSGSDYIPSQDPESNATEEPEDERDGEENDPEEEEQEEAEEHVPLAYQIPEDMLRAAMLAPPNTRASFWSTKLYLGPDGEEISTHYCKTKEVAERVAKKFKDEKVLGFDIEWRPFSSPKSIKQNASLIQLACEDRIALFHISQFYGTTAEQLMPPTLKAILESPDIYKVGVSVKGDFTRLQKYLNIQAQGVFELSRLHNLVEWHATDPKKVTNKLTGLAAQVLQHLQLPLYKGAQLDDDPEDTLNVRRSDWSKPLEPQQIHYAAVDAYAGFRLYHMLEWKRKQLRPTPPTHGLCDYDAKAAPRTKKPKKRRAAVKSGEESLSDLDQEEAEGEEEDGYDTASEELQDSSELEDPLQTSSASKQPAASKTNETGDQGNSAQKLVGRVNLSWLKGPDPGYPTLPQEPEGDHKHLAPSPILDQSVPHRNSLPVNSSPLARLASPDVYESDDEFADPDLEEALQVLELDADGSLSKTADSSSTEAAATESEPMSSDMTDIKGDGMQDTKPSSSTNQNTTDDIEISDYNPLGLEASESAPSHSRPTNDSTKEASHTLEYNAATTWAQDYLRSTIPSPTSTTPSRIRATVPHLRAYHLWHHQHLSIDDIAGHLRDPPLSSNTVRGYVLQAVSLEQLDYDGDAMRDLLTEMPLAMRKGKWRLISKKVDADA